MKDITHIFATIEQRINQQNDAQLIQFNARIIFEDDSSVLINSYPEFVAYNEVRNIVSSELHLTLLYLIKFHDKNVPEKQEINISFISNGTKTQVQRFINAVNSPRFESEDDTTDRRGVIQYEVKHTARTWATDLSALMSNSFVALIEEESNFRKFTKRNFFVLAFTLSFIVGSFIYVLNESDKKLAEEERIKRIENVFSKKNIDLKVINAELKYLAVHNEKAEGFPFGTIMPYASFIIFFIAYLVALDADYKKSFVLLTQASYKKKGISDIKYKRRTIVIITAIVSNVIIGILSSVIYEHIK